MIFKRLKNLWEWSRYSPNWVSSPKDVVEGADWLGSMSDSVKEKVADFAKEKIQQIGERMISRMQPHAIVIPYKKRDPVKEITEQQP